MKIDKNYHCFACGIGGDAIDYVSRMFGLTQYQAVIHRIYEPGCKFEIMVCLVGGQGAGKSTFFRFLALKDEWFSDDLKRMDDENVYRKMQGHWITDKKGFQKANDGMKVPFQ